MYDGMLGVVAAIECVHALNRRAAACPSRSKWWGSPTKKACVLTPRCSAAGRSPVPSIPRRSICATAPARRCAMRWRRSGSIRKDSGALRAGARRFSPTPNCTSSRARCSKPRAWRRAWSRRSTASRGSAVTLRGTAGHAGTVPMGLRRDTLAGSGRMRARGGTHRPFRSGTCRHGRSNQGAAWRDQCRSRGWRLHGGPAGAHQCAARARVAALRAEFAAVARRRLVDSTSNSCGRPVTRPARLADGAIHAVATEGRRRAVSCLGRRSRWHGDPRDRRHRHAVRALQRRHQPQSGGSDQEADAAIGTRMSASFHREIFHGEARKDGCRSRATIQEFLAAHQADKQRFWRSWSRCHPTTLRAIALRTRSAQRIARATGVRGRAPPVPANLVRASGMVSAINLVVRERSAPDR